MIRQYHRLNENEFEQTGRPWRAWHAIVHGSQRIGNDLVTEQQQQLLGHISLSIIFVLLDYIYLFLTCTKMYS